MASGQLPLATYRSWGVIAFKNAVSAYIRQNILLLTVLMLMFIAGVVFGSMGVIFLDVAQTKEIAFFVERIFKETTSCNSSGALLSTITTNIKLITIVWFLGLTIVGIPLVAAVVFTRGFALGFTSAFLIKLKGWAGVMTILLALFPPNVFAVPLLLFAATSSIVFSLCLLKSSKKEISISKNFLAFTLTMAVAAVLSACIGALQSYLSPLAVKVVFFTCGR